MDTEQYLDQLTRDSERLGDAAAAAGTDAPVPTCPGWTVTDLLQHMVRGDAWARTIVEHGQAGDTSRVMPSEPDASITGDALIAEFRVGAAAMIEILRSVDPGTSVWTFSAADRTARFWQRRRMQETSVHRFDAESAAGTTTRLDSALAADGVDEFLVSFLPRLADNVSALGDMTIHVHCTDVDGEWLLTQRDGELTVTREHAKGDVAARGSASDLMLFLWGRVDAGSLEVFGDTDLLARFSQAIKV
jgi:uncharacterized protein (TIGR03083 family)